MRIRIGIGIAASAVLLAACAGPGVAVRVDEDVVDSERHLPRNERERLAVEAAAKGADATRGEYTARYNGVAGGASLVTVKNPHGPEEDAPMEAVDYQVAGQWIERAGEVRYVAGSDELEETIRLVAKSAAASSAGTATSLMRTKMVSGRQQDTRCLVEVSVHTLDRRLLFTRGVNVCN